MGAPRKGLPIPATLTCCCLVLKTHLPGPVLNSSHCLLGRKPLTGCPQLSSEERNFQGHLRRLFSEP